ncbi:MAG: serine/threonine protein kinase [Solirubrobacterales bacterium]|nr:serine/threonine protein kinase [Solirubrobacterales bacterium]
MTTLLGTSLNDRYRLEARIAAGGMSTVYRAMDETLERAVAVKLLNREVATDSAQLERFRREARAVAQLSHPNIVGVIDAGDDQDPTHPRPYIVFEYVEGETLKDRIRRLRRLPITEAVAYAIEIARALGAAHARHIIHRDVKPQNVLIDAEGEARVTDFGIARTLEEEGLTADGRVLGTTDYVAPEQALGQDVTGQSDLYSLGVVLYEMLTGEVPFHGESQVAVAMKHVREELPDIQAKRPEVSATLAAVVETATAKREQDRYADMEELIADLEDVLAIETARAGSATGQVTSVLRTLPDRAQRRIPLRLRYPVVGAVAALVAAAVIVAVIVFLAPRTHHGTGLLPQPAPTQTPHQVQPCNTCAHDYNPDALSGPKNQHPNEVGLAIDGDRNTAWTTETYYDDDLGKPGVGLYVDASPGVVAGSLVLDTETPGYAVTIYATNTLPDADSFAASGWVKVGAAASVSQTQTIRLQTRGVRYRYYLVWITALGNHNQVAINEVRLFTR